MLLLHDKIVRSVWNIDKSSSTSHDEKGMTSPIKVINDKIVQTLRSIGLIALLQRFKIKYNFDTYFYRTITFYINIQHDSRDDDNIM